MRINAYETVTKDVSEAMQRLQGSSIVTARKQHSDSKEKVQ